MQGSSGIGAQPCVVLAPCMLVFRGKAEITEQTERRTRRYDA